MQRISMTMMLAALAALAGCAINRIERDVKPYVGRDIHELTAHLGKPTGKRETTGNAVYVWSTDSEGVLRTDSGAEATVDAQDVIQAYEVEGSQGTGPTDLTHRQSS